MGKMKNIFNYIYSSMSLVMKSIFIETDNAEFIKRIDKLTPSTPALWGKMNVSQMLAHSQVLLKVNLGELQLKQVFLGILFGKIAKKKILSEAPLERNLPTFRKALIKDDRSFEEEKKALKTLLKRLAEAGPEGISKNPHPFFGLLTVDEWDILQVKHLDHHLMQFGV
jgi:hypothetical protein